MKHFRWILTGIVMICLFGMTGCSMGEERETKEIRKYLESRYGSWDFEIQKEGTQEAPSYRVTLPKYPEVAFTVEEGKIQDSMDWQYHDDYAAQMLYGGAERLGLSWEKKGDSYTDGTGYEERDTYNIYIYYQDYSELDALAEKIAKLVSDCVESRAFEKLRNTCLIEIRPEGQTRKEFPGYQIRIKTLYTHQVRKEFGVMASDLDPAQFKEDLRLCHVYNSYNYMIPKDEAMFAEADVERYKAICTGAMGEEENGNITIYELVNKGLYGLNFGGTYQILSAQGLVTEVTDDSFTASGNGLTIRFSQEFINREAAVSYEILSGDKELVKEEERDTWYAVKAFTGQSISFSTPEKIQAAKDAERLERLPEILNAFENAAGPNQTGEAGGIEVSLLEVELYETMGSGFFYVESNEETVWTRLRLRLKNTGSTDVWIFPSTFTAGAEDKFTGIIADREANLYRPWDVVNLGLDDMYGETLAAGETMEGNVYFKLPRDLVSRENSLIMYYFCGSGTASVLFPGQD